MKIDFTTLKEKWTRPPKHQFPTGTRAYKGHQGQGKTLSMVYDTLKIFWEWDKCQLWSNVKINVDQQDLKRYHYFNDIKGLQEGLEYMNGADGVIVLIDEAHLFFNKKNGISLDVLTAISQQRKDRRKIIISSQIWEDLDISLRKQVPEIVACRCYFKRLQVNTIFKGETLRWSKEESSYVADKDYTYIFKHFDRLYARYNTFQKIVNNMEYNRDSKDNMVILQPSTIVKR